MYRLIVVSLIVASSSASVAQAESAGPSRGQALWTVSGAGAGFGVGL